MREDFLNDLAHGFEDGVVVDAREVVLGLLRAILEQHFYFILRF